MNWSTPMSAAFVPFLMCLAMMGQSFGQQLGGAQLVFPNAQQGTNQLQAEITRKLSSLKKVGSKESIAEAARIDEKYRAAKRVKDGQLQRSPKLELHVVGLYEGKASPEIDGRGAKVHVTMTHAPLILCLTAYEPVTWMLEVDDRVDLRQVIIGGQNGSVTGLPDGIPVADYSRPRETGKHVYYAYSKNDEDSGSQAYDRLCKNLEGITGMRPSSFDGDYNPRKTFVVGPESNLWCEEMSYGLMREAWLLATQSKRQAIWDELMALRFPATYSEGGDHFRGQSGKQYVGTHSVLGPIKGMVKPVAGPPNVRRANDGEFRLTRPTGEVDVLLWDNESHLPNPRGFGTSVFDSKRNRWIMVCNTESGSFMYAWSAADKSWSALRSMEGLRLHSGITYSQEQDRFFGIGSGTIMHTGRDFPIIYTLHPMGAALSRLPLDKLSSEGGHRHFDQTQLSVAGNYFLMKVTTRDHSQPESPQTVSTKVIDRESGDLVAEVPGLGIATVDEQQKRIAQLLRAEKNKAAGHLASIPKEKKKPRKPKRKPGEPRKAIAALENPINRHSYEIVTNAGDMTWKQAMTFAADSVHLGARGHLVTITSKEENDFLVANFASAGDTWAGGSDAENEGVWEWMCGPEIGDVFYEVGGNDNGFHNWAGRGANAGRGHHIEPNNSGNEEHYLHWNWRIGAGRNSDASGNWNDWDADRTCRYVIVEYSTTPAAIEFNRQRSRTPKSTSKRTNEEQATFKPREAVATYVTWNEGWQVHGFSMKENAWSTWNSPNSNTNPRGAKFAVGDKHVAIINPGADGAGWLLNRDSAKWTKLPLSEPPPAQRLGGDVIVGGENFQRGRNFRSVDFAHFVGNSLLASMARSGDTKTSVFDTKTNAWRSSSKSPLSGRVRSLNGVSGQHVFILGGYPNFLQDGAIYNTTKDRWMHLPEPPVKFKYGTDCYAHNGTFLVFGGQEQRGAAIFDIRTGDWKLLDSVPFDTAMSGVAVANDSLFVWSGYDEAEREAGVCDLKTGKWQRFGFGPLTPRCLTRTSVSDGKVIFFGGWDPSTEQFQTDGAIYDPAEKTWTPIPDLPASVPMALHPGW